ncbi:MAG: hypothetical protein KAS62_09360 [Candidatus Delongbacteria bacterium]|nr:hypothetical protein [Candidatus Delongbacteria bacterium]
MKNTIRYILVFIMLLAISQLFGQRRSSGQIAVRLTPTNKMIVGTSQNKHIQLEMNSEKKYNNVKLVNDITIKNNSITGWELIAESLNKGKLVNGNSELFYSIKVGNEKKRLTSSKKILSTKGLGKIDSTKFDLMMDINSKEAFKTQGNLTGIYKDTINLTLFSND